MKCEILFRVNKAWKKRFYLKFIPKIEKNKTNTIPNMHELIVIPKIPLEKSKIEIIGVKAM